MAKTLYSVPEAANMLGLSAHRVAYAVRSLKAGRYEFAAGRRLLRVRNIARLAEHFGVKLPNELWQTNAWEENAKRVDEELTHALGPLS